ncbi:hypothetical protein COK29_30400, partial [Bacillus cereus]|uniref:anthrax toxin lethal factor-related metalloendopeptidase n=1 Tax=Bacillus cereus TaxID=1396 RepID=UPI000C01BD47
AVSVFLALKNVLDQREDVGMVFRHEMGHVLDCYAHNKLMAPSNEFVEITSMPDFQEIFKKEGDNLTEYGSKNPAEFFAEAFYMLTAKDPEALNSLKANAPETYKYLVDLISKLKLQAEHE